MTLYEVAVLIYRCPYCYHSWDRLRKLNQHITSKHGKDTIRLPAWVVSELDEYRKTHAGK